MEMKVTIDKEATLAEAETMWEEPLSPISMSFVRTLCTHIVVIIGFDCPIDIDVFRAQLPFVLNHPRFSSVMVEGVKGGKEEMKWVQTPQVNVDNHIVVPSINSAALSNNRVTADEFVEDYLHTLTKTSLDVSKVPWEAHLLNVRTSEAESLAILRIHHSLGDGISITSHILAWTRQVSNPDALPTIATMKKKKKEENDKINDNRRCWELPWSFILAVWWWIQVLCNTVIDILMFIVSSFLKDSDILTTSRRDTNTKERRIAYKIVSLDDMKLIKNALNATINDVAIAIIEAGFSRHLIRRFGNSKNLQKIRLRITIAVNQRSMKGIQGLEDIKNKDSKLGLGNQIGYVKLPLSIRHRDDPLEYVRNAKATIDRKKRSLGAQLSFKLRKLAARMFGFKFTGSMMLKMFNASIGVSSLPGPVEETAFFGHPIKFIAPTVYGIPVPILIHLQSCGSKMTIVISVGDDVIIEPHELQDDIIQSLFLMKDAVMKMKYESLSESLAS